MFEKLFGKARKPDSKGVWRQGDVFIIPTQRVPDQAQPARPVLAEGEVTGHAHRLCDPSRAQMFRLGEIGYLEVNADDATIVHEEHGPVTVPRGAYEIRIQREYHPKEIRKVID
jgi:hypothetical protein